MVCVLQVVFYNYRAYLRRLTVSHKGITMNIAVSLIINGEAEERFMRSLLRPIV